MPSNATMHAEPPLRVELRPSRRAIVFVLASHGLTAALLVAMPWPWPPGALVVAVIMAWTLWQLRARNATVLIVAGLDGRIAITRGDGSVACGRVHVDTYVGSTLATLVWQPDGARWPRTLLLLPDALDRAEFRRLRVALRYCRVAETGSGASEIDAG